jgi:aspartokinase-like uncharacterized kinase
VSDVLKQPKVMNVIIVYDVGCVATDWEPATAAVLELINSGELKPTHQKAIPIIAGQVPEKWRGDRPIVADDVPDEVFEQLRGKTIHEAHDFLSKKQPA